MYRYILCWIAILYVSALMGGLTAKAQQDLGPQLDAFISQQLQGDGNFNEALRAFHKCIVNQAKIGRLKTVGVLAIFSSGEACEEVANFLFRECMNVQKNEQNCSTVVVTTSLHADKHYEKYQYK